MVAEAGDARLLLHRNCRRAENPAERNSYLRNGGTMKRNKRAILAFTIPGTLLFLLTFVYPIIRTVIMSFSPSRKSRIRYPNGLSAESKNYTALFQNSLFQTSFMESFSAYGCTAGSLSWRCPQALATILTSGVRGKGFSRPRFISPNVISAVAMAT